MRKLLTCSVLSISCLATTLFLPSCRKNPAASDQADILLPLTIGNYWAYEQLTTRSGGGFISGLTDSAKVANVGTTTVTFEGHSYRAAILQWFYPLGNPTDFKWFYRNGDNGLYLLGGMSSTDTLVHKMLGYKYPAQEGDSWEIQRLLYNFYTQEFELEDTTTIYTCVATDEAFTTPAGTFTCYVYHHRVTIWEEPGLPIEDWDYYEYYAPGVGLVGTLIRSGIDGHLKWKTWLYDYQVD